MAEFEYIQLPVPKHLIAEVMGLIAAKMAPETAAVQDVQDVGKAQPASITKELAERMYKESAAHMRKALKILAKSPGKPVPSLDLAKAVHGATAQAAKQLTGVMGAFGHRCTSRYGNVRPFSTDRNYLTACWEYTMPANVASWIAPLP